jgi:hypothetical protein
LPQKYTLLWQISNQQPKRATMYPIKKQTSKGPNILRFSAQNTSQHPKLFLGKNIDFRCSRCWTPFFPSAREGRFLNIACLVRTKIKQLAEYEKAGYTRENVSEKNETRELLAGGRQKRRTHAHQKMSATKQLSV